MERAVLVLRDSICGQVSDLDEPNFSLPLPNVDVFTPDILVYAHATFVHHLFQVAMPWTPGGANGPLRRKLE